MNYDEHVKCWKCICLLPLYDFRIIHPCMMLNNCVPLHVLCISVCICIKELCIMSSLCLSCLISAFIYPCPCSWGCFPSCMWYSSHPLRRCKGRGRDIVHGGKVTGCLVFLWIRQDTESSSLQISEFAMVYGFTCANDMMM